MKDSTEDQTDWIDLPPEELMGEAMRRLNPRQQKFVCALAVFGGDQQKAYAYAGYKSANERTAAACSSRLAANPDVQEAIREETLRRIGTNSLMAISVIVQLAADPKVKPAVRLAAAKELAGLNGHVVKSEHKITVEDTRSATQIAQNIMEMLKQPEIKKLGVVASVPLPIGAGNIRDAEFSEVPDELKDLF